MQLDNIQEEAFLHSFPEKALEGFKHDYPEIYKVFTETDNERIMYKKNEYAYRRFNEKDERFH